MPFWAPLATAAAQSTGSGGGGGIPGLNNSSRSGDITVPLDFSFDRQFNPPADDASFGDSTAAIVLAIGLVSIVAYRLLRG